MKKILLEKASLITRALAVESGEELLDLWRTARIVKSKDSRDFSTQYDQIIEEKIKSALTKSFPDYGFVLEEEKNIHEDAEFCWVIDPIDGTKYFESMVPVFSVSIGLFNGEKPILGTIYNPVSRQLYYSYSGLGGIYRGTKFLAKNDEITKNSAPILILDMSKSNEVKDIKNKSWFREKYSQILETFYRVRMIGNGSLTFAWMCEGAFDAYIDLTGKTKLVDIAAGIALYKEIGGKSEFIKCADGQTRLIAAKEEKLFSEIKKIILQ